MGILYFLVAIIATTVGALAGLGGGVIIKPSLDLLGHYNITTISMLSTITVFSMATVATFKQVRNGFIISKSIVFLALGALLGGIFGKVLFSLLISRVIEATASGIQAITITLLLIIVMLRGVLPDFEVKNPIIILMVGLGLGTTASFLGIGGGPINVAVIMMVLRMDIKKAAVSSVFVVLLSQLSKILTVAFTSGFSDMDLSMLYFMIPGAIGGGLIGSLLSNRLRHEQIVVIFNLLVIALIGLNLYLAYSFFF